MPYNLFGFQILSKRERMEKERAYRKEIFPGGFEEKRQVLSELKKAAPRCEDEILLYLYIELRDHMKKNRLTPEEAWKSYRSDLPVRFRKEEADAFIEVLKKRQAPSAAGENGTSGDPAHDR